MTTSWFRGNTHTHTVLCGHADSEPEVVVRWYHDHGYQFVSLSEHNIMIEPDSIALPPNARTDFLVVQGEEVTSPEVHMTAFNITEQPKHGTKPTLAATLDSWVNRIHRAGGTPVFNHPNFRWQLSVSDLVPDRPCRLFEVWNGHPAAHNDGDDSHLSTDDMWDSILTDGGVLYGVASDDAHHFAHWGPEYSNPGRGWVMVDASELTSPALADALVRGWFYSSNGVMLGDYAVTDEEIRLVVDARATSLEIAKAETIGQPVSGQVDEGVTVEFIGPHGEVLQSSAEGQATYRRSASNAYARARVTVVVNSESGRVAYRAWAQPVFEDDRHSR